jgi:hypothetical protein
MIVGLTSGRPRVMSGRRINWLSKAGLGITALVMLVATGLLSYRLVTGQAS